MIEIPPILYKFIPPSHGCIKDIRFSQPQSFNDPLDGRPCISIENVSFEKIEQILIGESKKISYIKRNKLNKDSVRKATLKQLYKTNKEKFLSILENSAYEAVGHIGVLCLCSSWEGVPMWAHYTDNHKGYCVGIDTSHKFFQTDESSKIIKVEYFQKRPITNFSEITNLNAIKNLLGNKDARWKYEEEIRMIRHLSTLHTVIDKNTNQEKVDLKNNIMFFKELPNEAVKEVIIGHDCKDDFKKEIIEWAKKFPNSKTYKITIPYREYEFSRKEIL